MNLIIMLNIKILKKKIRYSYSSLKIGKVLLKKTEIVLWENTPLGLRQIVLLKNHWFQINKL